MPTSVLTAIDACASHRRWNDDSSRSWNSVENGVDAYVYIKSALGEKKESERK